MSRIEKIADAYHAADVDGELVLMHADTGKFFALKDSSVAIWNMLDSESDLDTIEAELTRKYAVDPETCRAELRTFADQLVASGFARYS